MKYLLGLIAAAFLAAGGAKGEEDLPQVAPEVMGKVYLMMQMLDGAFEKERVQYWIGGGTVLGYVRAGALIPWEASAHFEFFQDDWAQIERALTTLQEKNFTFEYNAKERVFTFHKVGEDEPTIYLFGMQFSRRTKVYESAQVHPWGPSYWTPTELQKRSRVKVGPVEVSMPSSVFYYIKRRYGMGALSTAIVKLGPTFYKIPLTKRHPTPYKFPPGWKTLSISRSTQCL